MEVNQWLNENPLSMNIFDKKYRDGDETLDEWFERVSHGYEPIKQMLEEKKFLFGGRILANRGVKDRKVTLSNCFRGDTKIITPDGLKELKDLKGKRIKVLSQSEWRDADVRSFGVQPLRILKLSKGMETRVFYVTGDHLWVVNKGWGSTGLETTDNLKEGDVIPNESLNKFQANGLGWTVDSVEDANTEEEVFCAIVPTTHTFALEGGILTHNCYVIEPPKDNIESIFECSSKLARTYSYGGGCGTDISNLRPNQATVHNASKTSSGPVSFMDLFSQVTQTISQNGRRGALMLCMDIRHPDSEEFIDCKTDLNKVTFANISLRVSDDFMQAVDNDTDYILRWPCNLDENKEVWQYIEKCNDPYKKLCEVNDKDGNNIGYYKRVKARELFNKLVKNNWDYAEPGILFWDRISNYNLLNNTDFKFAATNPCGELPLPPGGSCLLGSINLSEFVANPFTKSAKVDYDALEKAVYTAIVGLNQCLIEGMNLHPLQEQRESVGKWHQVGLGTMGLADMLIKLGIRYGTDQSLKTIECVYKCIAVAAITESLQLAKEHGCYPGCEKEKLPDSSFIKALNLPEAMLDDIRQYGLYNSELLTCAPTGSIGTMLEISTGVEPNFALKYTRKTQSLEGKDVYYDVSAKIVEDYRKVTGNEGELPDYFVTSADITPVERIKVQGMLQKYIDASISSTVNLAKEATTDDVKDVYMSAWKEGLKGVTVYRSGCKREGILTTDKPAVTEIPNTSAPKRPKELEADFYLTKSKGKQYIIMVGLLNGKPYEVFAFEPNMDINCKQHKGVIIKKSKMHYCFKSDQLEIKDLVLANENIEERAATLYASMLLRHGVNINYVIKTAKKVNDNITSFSSAMCRILAKYASPENLTEKCPECGGELVREEGCVHCKDCGWSRCG